MIRSVGAALVLVTALAAASAQPAPTSTTETEAKKFHARGDLAYDQGRYADAVANYREAYNLKPKPALLYNIAYCEELLGDLERAYLDYARFVAAAPEHKRHSETEQHMKDLTPRIRVKAQVSSSPPGAAIFVDGADQPAARTPAVIEVAPGPHRVRIEVDHATPREVDLDAKIGAISMLDVVLARHGIVDLVSEPGDATIARRDLPDVRVRGRYRAELPPGRYSFLVERAGYTSEDIDITLDAGADVRRNVVLDRPAPRSGVLVVAAPAGATVTVDAVNSGAAPARFQLVEGPHFVIVERPGHGTYRGSVTVAASQTTTLDVSQSRHRSRTRRRVTWGLAGLGASALAAGGVFGLLALRDDAAYQTTPSASLGDRAEARALTADVLLGTGAVALLSAAILHWTGSDGGASSRTSGAP